jgi:hypothetical protein
MRDRRHIECRRRPVRWQKHQSLRGSLRLQAAPNFWRTFWNLRVLILAMCCLDYLRLRECDRHHGIQQCRDCVPGTYGRQGKAAGFGSRRLCCLCDRPRRREAAGVLGMGNHFSSRHSPEPSRREHISGEYDSPLSEMRGWQWQNQQNRLRCRFLQ